MGLFRVGCYCFSSMFIRLGILFSLLLSLWAYFKVCVLVAALYHVSELGLFPGLVPNAFPLLFKKKNIIIKVKLKPRSI